MGHLHCALDLADEPFGPAVEPALKAEPPEKGCRFPGLSSFRPVKSR
jgi:hypothetical protein